jgi:hypothetical protein
MNPIWQVLPSDFALTSFGRNDFYSTLPRVSRWGANTLNEAGT